jgi:GxxExxY protein
MECDKHHLRKVASIDAVRFVQLYAGMTFNPDAPITKITEVVIGAAIEVHRELGPGLLESAYQACLAYELGQRNVKFARQVPLPVTYRNVSLECGYRLDFVVEGSVVVEIKSVDRLAPIHSAQLITYLKLTGCPVGLLLNFNVTALRRGIRRLENRHVTHREIGEIREKSNREVWPSHFFPPRPP